MSIAILLNGGVVVGYNYDVAACAASGASFIEVSEVPQALIDLQANQQLRFIDGAYVVEQLAQPLSELDALKQQVQELTTTLGDLILDGGL